LSRHRFRCWMWACGWALRQLHRHFGADC
jgi:hypothetical protein